MLEVNPECETTGHSACTFGGYVVVDLILQAARQHPVSLIASSGGLIVNGQVAFARHVEHESWRAVTANRALYEIHGEFHNCRRHTAGTFGGYVLKMS